MKIIYEFLIFTLFISVASCLKEEAIPVSVSFSVKVVGDDFSVPVRVQLTNNTEGADTYNWSFEGGDPSSSIKKDPGTITYENPGNYTIILKASNADNSEDTASDVLQIDASVIPRFEIEVLKNTFFPPVEVKIHNKSVGATSFLWKFEGGEPATSEDQNPPNVVFEKPGDHKIKLTVSNGRETYDLEKSITVAPHLVSKFDFKVAFEDDDYQVPVQLTMINQSVSATSFLWKFEGGKPTTSEEKDSLNVVFENPGTYKIKLTASNGKETKKFTRDIEVFKNTNLRTYKGVQLGISTAHNKNKIGAFFSTETREVYSESKVTEEIGPKIDLVFFGVNSEFAKNKFFSPNEKKKDFPFNPIPGAVKTKFINNQELHCKNDPTLCDNKSVLLSASDFDAMNNDAPIKDLKISETAGGSQYFNNEVAPRIVLFETHDGRKGAIKIKEFVENGDSSHILVDIKVQKEARKEAR